MLFGPTATSAGFEVAGALAASVVGLSVLRLIHTSNGQHREARLPDRQSIVRHVVFGVSFLATYALGPTLFAASNHGSVNLQFLFQTTYVVVAAFALLSLASVVAYWSWTVLGRPVGAATNIAPKEVAAQAGAAGFGTLAALCVLYLWLRWTPRVVDGFGIFLALFVTTRLLPRQAKPRAVRNMLPSSVFPIILCMLLIGVGWQSLMKNYTGVQPAHILQSFAGMLPRLEILRREAGPSPISEARAYLVPGFRRLLVLREALPGRAPLLTLNSAYVLIPVGFQSPLLPPGKINDTLDVLYAPFFSCLMIGEPMDAYRALRKQELNYFYVEKDDRAARLNIPDFWGIGISPIFDTDKIERHFDVFWEDAEGLILTWRGLGRRPANGEDGALIAALRRNQTTRQPGYNEMLERWRRAAPVAGPCPA
jgi:hypothetical protein